MTGCESPGEVENMHDDVALFIDAAAIIALLLLLLWLLLRRR